MGASISKQIAPVLPYLRRYARALTGSQDSGDAYVRSCLEALVDGSQVLPDASSPRIATYALFHRIWATAQPQSPGAHELPGSAQDPTARRLSTITPASRQAFLLTAMELFSDAETAEIMGIEPAEVAILVKNAMAEVEAGTKDRVMIIEDEPMIAMDLTEIVEDMGHAVTGVAATRDEAAALFDKDQPGLVLSDIQLADGSSGLDAVNDILGQTTVPVIFITAFPERLLTGERPEPAFLITKPFNPKTVRAAIAQSLFFKNDAA